MIGRLVGQLYEKSPPRIGIDVQGIGYEVDVPMSTFCNLPQVGETVTLLIHMAVREDAQLLYGFATAEERSTFRELIKVTGIGAKIALAVLSGLSVSELALAIQTQQADLLVRVPGIGKKTAQRLLLELKGKLGQPDETTGIVNATLPAQLEVQAALMALGYSEKESAKAIKHLPEGIDVTEGIRQVLKQMNR